MEKTILDFYFDYLNISLSQVKDKVISNINHGFIKMYEEQLFKRSEGSGMFDILSCRFWDVCICKSFSGQFLAFARFPDIMGYLQSMYFS